MSTDPLVSGSFVATDYVVFSLMLTVSAAVGVYFVWADRTQRSSGDFLLGGRSLNALPVSLSLIASFISAITVLSTPAEVYLYGAIIILYCLSFIMAIVITSEIFLPVFYRLAITSTNEYLELRFNRATRLLGTVVYIFQTVVYAGIVIYTPALALSQVTGMDLWGAVAATGIVCTFYTTLGGLKAVVWTDVFQLGIMFAGFLSVIIRSVILRGGVYPIISDSQQGGRLNILDFDINPLRRHTFWTITFGGAFTWTVVYGINQAQVQRYISCKSITHARLSLYINLVGLVTIMLSAVFIGMCLFSFYKNCDPWSAGLVSKADQLVPFLVMAIFKDHPGLPGLFVAAAYSGSLSTVSSCINALATVTLEDFIKPYTNMSEKHLSWMSRGLSIAYGVLCIGMAALSSLMGGMLQAAISINGVLGGPLLGLFTLGILCPFANSKGALSGLMSGLVVSLWICIGAQIHPPPPELARPLSLATDGCNFTTTDNLNWTSTVLPTQTTTFTTASEHSIDGTPPLAVYRYSLSYLYFSFIGTIVALIVGLLISFLTGGWTQRAESRFTLMKEDTTLYHMAMCFKDRAMRLTGIRKGELVGVTRDRKLIGSSNPTFCDAELN